MFLALMLALILWLLPLLARRGDLNALVEAVIRQSFHVPVSIGSIDTDPLSRLAITRISSLSAGAEGRFRFHCGRLEMVYRPWDLWLGSLEELSLIQPDLFLNLDRDLSGIIAPEAMTPSREGGREPGEAASSDFKLGHLRLEAGRLALRYAEKEFILESLGAEVFGIGGRDAFTFHFKGALGGAALEASGTIIPRDGGLASPVLGPQSAGGPRRYQVQGLELKVRRLDLRPFLHLLAPLLPGVEGEGAFDFTGTAEGVWPERVQVRLESAISGAAAKAAGQTFSRGKLALSLKAEVLGELEEVDFDFHLSTEGDLASPERGSREQVDLRLLGKYRKKEGPDPGGSRGGGSIILATPSRLEAKGLGSVEIAGGLRSLLDQPALDLSFHLAGLDLASAREHAFLDRFGGLVQPLSGALAADFRLEGPLSSPRLGAEFCLQAGELQLGKERVRIAALRGRLARLENFLGGGKLAARGVHADCQGLDAGAVARLSGVDPKLFSAGGKLALELEAPLLEAGQPPASLSLSFKVEEGEFSFRDGLAATEKAVLEGKVQASSASAAPAEAPFPPFHAAVKVELRAPVLALGAALEPLGDEPAFFQGTADLQPLQSSPGSAWRLQASVDGSFGLPSLPRVSIRGTVSALAGGGEESGQTSPRLDLEAVSAPIPNQSFLAIHLRDALKERFAFLEGAEFGGTSSFALRLQGAIDALEIHGTVRAENAEAHLPRIGLEVAGLSAQLPIAWGGGRPAGLASESSAGGLTVERVRLGPIGIERLELPVVLEPDRYRLREGGTSFELLGGKAHCRSLEVGLGPGRPPFKLSLRAEGLQLEKIARPLGFQGMEGSVEADFQSAAVQDDRIAVDGFVRARVFGGEVYLSDLAIDHFTEPYLTVSLATGTVRELNLFKLGEAFQFGLMSGTLQGSVKNFVFTPGAVSRFEIEVETVKRPGVAQFINKNAIESIQRIISGPLYSLEELFFSKFRYAGFGFAASLSRNRFRLQGKFNLGGVEHLMYSHWWQFPKIRIINSQPQKDYDWRRIYSNLRGVLQPGSRPEEGSAREPAE